MVAIDKQTKVLVTQAGLRNGFVLTYSLGEIGIPVYCADSHKFSQTRYSRYCRNYATYPLPHIDPDGYFNAINSIVDRFDIGLIFPAYDEMIFLSQYRHKLVNSKLLISPPYEDIISVHKKTSLSKLCNDIGCNSPLTIEINNISDIDKAISLLSFPFILKPERGGGGWGVSIINNPKDILEKWKSFDRDKHNNKLFAQQYINGSLYCYGVLCSNGKILASNCFQTLRHHGTSCFRRGLVVEEIESQAEKLFQHLHWTGVCQCDYMLDNEGRAYLIDVNPRFWGSTAQGLASGINFPYLLYLLGTEQHDGSIIRRTGIGVTSLWLWGDFFVMCERLLKESNKFSVLRDHISSWTKAYIDDLRFDDPLPFLLYPVQKLVYTLTNDDTGGF